MLNAKTACITRSTNPKNTRPLYIQVVWRGFCWDLPENWGFRKIRGFLWITFGDKSEVRGGAVGRGCTQCGFAVKQKHVNRKDRKERKDHCIHLTTEYTEYTEADHTELNLPPSLFSVSFRVFRGQNLLNLRRNQRIGALMHAEGCRALSAAFGMRGGVGVRYRRGGRRVFVRGLGKIFADWGRSIGRHSDRATPEGHRTYNAG